MLNLHLLIFSVDVTKTVFRFVLMQAFVTWAALAAKLFRFYYKKFAPFLCYFYCLFNYLLSSLPPCSQQRGWRTCIIASEKGHSVMQSHRAARDGGGVVLLRRQCRSHPPFGELARERERERECVCVCVCVFACVCVCVCVKCKRNERIELTFGIGGRLGNLSIFVNLSENPEHKMKRG